ncbi:MAG: antitoxin [Bacteroidales bacterium]
MTLTAEERNAIVSYRILKAKETFGEVESLCSSGFWDNAGSRLYYSLYYMVSALLVRHGYIAHTHRGTRNLLALHFVKTGILEEEELKLYSKLFDYRVKGDYEDFFDLEGEDILPLIEPAKELLFKIERLISSNDGAAVSKKN